MRKKLKFYKIYYNDGCFAEIITFINRTRKQREKYFIKAIRLYNTNINKDYHISFRNIVRVN